MSKNYLQILELAASLSKEECIMLIKDISTALVEKDDKIDNKFEQAIFQRALETRRKVRAGEMKTWSLKEAKERMDARK